MILWLLITQPASAFREFVALRYRPELHYMRGPGPAYARRAVMVGREAVWSTVTSGRTAVVITAASLMTARGPHPAACWRA